MLAVVGSVLLVASAGVALAANITCLGGPCVGTEQNDRITGSQVDDEIHALGGRDEVTARGADDHVEGGAGRDDIAGGAGGDFLVGGRGSDDINGGPGTADSEPRVTAGCFIFDESAEINASIEATQDVRGFEGNDDLDGGRDNDYLDGGTGTNDLSGNGGDDCLVLRGDENERASGGDGDDIFDSIDVNGDDIFCGAGHDGVEADAEDRVAADCEDVLRPFAFQAPGSTPVMEGTITMTP